MQIIRPFSASRVKDRSLEAQQDKSCSGCEALEEQLREGREKLAAARREVECIEGKIAGMQREKEELLALKLSLEQKNSLLMRKSGDSAEAGQGKDLEELRKKIAVLEKSVKGKEEEVRAAKKNLEEEAAKSSKMVKEVKEKKDKIKELERLLAESSGKVRGGAVTALEKKLNDLSLNLKANDESNDGAFQREKQLLKQVELLTQEMTEARKEAERSVAKVNGLQKEKEELQSSLGSLRTRMKEESQEADAIQRKLIAELKQLRDELASSQGEVATRDKLIARIEVQVKNGKVRR
eukprot:761751-Hanusia_phi.AAC.1